jgi:uncharacterized membrane protein YhhN
VLARAFYQVQAAFMPKRALVEKRPYLLGSIAAAVAFYLVDGGELGELYVALIKGAAVGLLAVYAWHRSPSRDVHLIAAVMAMAALADMVIEFYEVEGGAVFFVSHLLALALYLQPHNRRKTPTESQKAAGVALLVLTPLAAFLLTRDPPVALYALALGAMAAAAWTSRFSRYHVGIGALLFVASDLLIFARMGGTLTGIASWLVWPTYYVGQFLICTGVVQTLRQDHQA